MMLWTQYLLSLAGILGFSLFLFQRLNEKASHSQYLQGIWAKLDVVGASPVNKLSFFGAVARSIVSTRQLANEGYLKFSKTLGRPFALPTTWVRSGALMVLPPSMVPLLTRPDKTSEGEWVNLRGLVENIQLPYVVGDPDVYLNLLQFEAVRRKMQNRDMGRLAPVTAEEIDEAFRDIWGTETTWKTINGWDACGRVISRSSQRILFGLPLSRDEALLETSRNYATSLLVGGAIINCFPPALRWLAGPLVALRAKYFQSRFVKMLVPVVEERIRRWEVDKNDGPDDFLQWMIPICAKEGADQLDATRIALRLVSLLIPLIYAVCFVFAQCVFDILGSAACSDVWASLEEECARVSAQHAGFATSESVNKLFRIDSALRESMRVSGVSVTNLFRDVTTGEIDIGNGFRVGPGVRMAFPTQNIHLDPDNYENPRQFDALRFSRPFEDAQGNVGERELVVTTTPTFLPFSYGRHACPGRWFAAQVMKQALAYIVLNYNIELVGRPVKKMALLNTMVPPVNTRIRIQRKR
ncbi:cytochrome P450 [Annulohypoxylon bovei var. microspora]|nr:cytochrome P450 [Annulohypoxylon bovei var. microspora]